jgi:hypothetical protein
VRLAKTQTNNAKTKKGFPKQQKLKKLPKKNQK